jgi:hypothetical protein
MLTYTDVADGLFFFPSPLECFECNEVFINSFFDTANWFVGCGIIVCHIYVML